ncbi:MAG: aspartyl-tRNA amidotransferase subunit B [Chitinophagales bacterium]|nr:MAG: aspartyl-tRNA amidotransferase subunit B [Chitinophagales bacterium]
MNLEQKVAAAMKEAMLAKDQAALRGLRAIKAAITLAQTAEGGKKNLDAAQEVQLLQKLIKQRKDSLAIYTQQRRDDLAQKEREEIEVIEKFLPQQLSPEEIKEILKKIIADSGASGIKDMGKVMGLATRELAGRADNKTVADMVKMLLTQTV